MNSNLSGGFIYTVEVLKNGEVVDSEVVHNLIPTEGLNHMLATEFAGGTPVATWYIGLYEANYTPVAGDTAATFVGLATETTTYTEATRRAFVPGAVAGGSVSNTASKAEFTSSANKTVYGAFMTSAAAKGATSGVLISAVKFASPKTFDLDSVLRVTAGFTAASA